MYLCECMYGGDAGGLNHKDSVQFKLLFATERSLGSAPSNFFYLGTRKVLFFVECEV